MTQLVGKRNARRKLNGPIGALFLVRVAWVTRAFFKRFIVMRICKPCVTVTRSRPMREPRGPLLQRARRILVEKCCLKSKVGLKRASFLSATVGWLGSLT